MIGWVLLAVYVAGYVFAARKASVTIMKDDVIGGDEDAFDRAMSRALGALVALFWPVILLGAIVTGKLPKSDKQLRAELAKRDARIAELEREAGIH